jgi:hypothetical protein
MRGMDGEFSVTVKLLDEGTPLREAKLNEEQLNFALKSCASIEKLVEFMEVVHPASFAHPPGQYHAPECYLNATIRFTEKGELPRKLDLSRKQLKFLVKHCDCLDHLVGALRVLSPDIFGDLVTPTERSLGNPGLPR